MDPAGWFEVTPESVSRHIADRMPYDLVVDGTCGVGGNAIQFAMTSRRVIGVDIDNARLLDASHNAAIYGVQDRIDFVCDDFAHFALTYEGPPIDAVFLSPPWGGPAHLDCDHFSFKHVPCPDIVKLFSAAATVSKRVVLYLPRHQDLNEIVLVASANGFGACEVEKVFFQYPTPHLKLVCVYFSPEAAALPLPVAGGSKKKVGPTGKETRKALGSTVTGAGRASGLSGLPPLAGPIIRALYCRLHYLGRFVVAAAVVADRAGCQASRNAQALAEPISSGHCHPLQRRRAAIAFTKAIAPSSSQQSRGEGEDGAKLTAFLLWLLGEVPLRDVARIVEESIQAFPDSNSCARLEELLKKQLPEVHHSLLSSRKAAALRGIT